MTTSPASLPRDIYYRGYRLSTQGDGHPENDTLIYSGIKHIDTCGSLAAARAQVDEWLNAR